MLVVLLVICASVLGLYALLRQPSVRTEKSLKEESEPQASEAGDTKESNNKLAQ